jgi:hypothetical protein
MVLRRAEGYDRPPALVGSGTEEDRRTAMTKAVRMADRLVEPAPEGNAAARGLTTAAGEEHVHPPAPTGTVRFGRGRDRHRYHGSMFREANSRER